MRPRSDYARSERCAGTDGNPLLYAGDSAAVDFLGEALVELGSESAIVTVTLSVERLQALRARFPAWLDADEFELRR